MKKLVLITLLLSGCGTKFGASLGDMTYYHKARCDKPATEWVDEGYAPIGKPSKRRLGGAMFPTTVQKVDGHWHYYC